MKESKRRPFSFLILIFLITSLIFLKTGCNQDSFPAHLESQFIDIKPDYDRVKLLITNDSLHFSLPEDFYSDIKSFNSFISDDTVYLAFFEKKSHSVCIYNSENNALAARVYLPDSIVGKKIRNVSVYCLNFDSIFVATRKNIFILDSEGRRRNSFELIPDPVVTRKLKSDVSISIETTLDNVRPPIIKGDILFTAISPITMSKRSLDAASRNRVMYGFNMKNSGISMYYNFTKLYRLHYFSPSFQDYSYCVNDAGNFVFSFFADPNIYVTDLIDTSMAFTGKSRSQKKEIPPLDKVSDSLYPEILHYATNYKYGSIFFDHKMKRYLRTALSGITKEQYESMDTSAHNRRYVVIFDEKFKIIGDSEIPTGVSMSTVFFSQNGDMYARVNSRDEQKIHFVKLYYLDDSTKVKSLAFK